MQKMSFIVDNLDAWTHAIKNDKLFIPIALEPINQLPIPRLFSSIQWIDLCDQYKQLDQSSVQDIVERIQVVITKQENRAKEITALASRFHLSGEDYKLNQDDSESNNLIYFKIATKGYA